MTLIDRGISVTGRSSPKASEKSVDVGKMLFGAKASTVTGVKSWVPAALDAVWPLARLATNRDAIGAVNLACRTIVRRRNLSRRSLRRRIKRLPAAEIEGFNLCDDEIAETPCGSIIVHVLQILLGSSKAGGAYVQEQELLKILIVTKTSRLRSITAKKGKGSISI
jgi:hypothetical protein